jgi:general nucleoside transport system permease protein
MTVKSINKPSSLNRLVVFLLTNRIVSLLIAVILSLVITSVIILATKTSPIKVFSIIFSGAFGSTDQLAQVIQSWIPLVLTSVGLMFTFTAGLWNIGMEGQVEMGAIFAYAIIFTFTGTNTPGWEVITLSVLSGVVGGIFWSLLVCLLKIYGGVNEIFGGLGFNFIADAVLLYLVYGPWRPSGNATGSTALLPTKFWMPTIAGTSLNLPAVIIAVIGIIFVTVILQGTYFGLKLKAVGKNNKAAFLLGTHTTRYMVLAFILCGIFAGLAGGLQVVGFNHVLRNNISGGYGYLGLMVGMLANYQPFIAIPIAFIFTALSKGSNGLVIDLKLDSNFPGVIQGLLVVFVLLMAGVRQLVSKKNKGATS